MVSRFFISWICHFWARFWLNFNFGDFRAYFGYFSLVKIDFFEIYFQSWRIKLRVLKFFRPILIIKRHQKNTQAKLFEKFASRQHALLFICQQFWYSLLYFLGCRVNRSRYEKVFYQIYWYFLRRTCSPILWEEWFLWRVHLSNWQRHLWPTKMSFTGAPNCSHNGLTINRLKTFQPVFSGLDICLENIDNPSNNCI